MFQLNTPKLYAKGTCNVVVRDPATGDVDYQSNKVITNQLSTTVDMGEIRAGIGNSVAINIPHNSAVSLNLTAADFSMPVRAMSVGANLAYGGIAPVCEAITANSTILTVSNEAVAPYGLNTPVCNIVQQGVLGTSNGVAYSIDANGNIEGFEATEGATYIVTYFTRNASSQYFNIGGNFAPAIKHVTVQIAVYSTEGTQNANQGTKVGDLYIIIPRMQFSGKADVNGDQTANAVTDLSGTALTYDEAPGGAGCSDCAIPGLAQVLYVPNSGVDSAVQGMAVVGGAMNISATQSAKLPIKWLMPDGSLVQPDYTAMIYAIPDNGASVASVDATGTVTGVGEGSTTITTTLVNNPAVSCIADINVTA